MMVPKQSTLLGVTALAATVAAAAATVLMIRRRRQLQESSTEVSELSGGLDRSLTVTAARLNEILEGFEGEMDKGLHVHGGSTMKMYPSYVSAVPNGEEKGTFYALDLGGTNFRVLRVELSGNEEAPRIEQQKFKVPEECMTGSADALFDFLATCVKSFQQSHNTFSPHSQPKVVYVLGFTFSFPCQQDRIDRGTLVRWTKGFSASGTVGADVVRLLRCAFQRNHIEIEVKALVNDTVGTLMACSYRNPDCCMGVILGTGTNAAYVEDLDKIFKLTDSDRQGFNSKKMIINMEWGAFDDDKQLLPLTMFDELIDAQSINAKEQIFEKMISGMYLGEIARLVLLHVSQISETPLFGGEFGLFSQQHGLETALMSLVEEDKTSTLSHLQDALADLGIQSTTHDRFVMLKVCELVSTRAARLSAMGIGAVVRKTGKLGTAVTVGIDGSLFEKYPHFKQRMEGGLEDLFGASAASQIKLVHSGDGSGLGAALTAATAS